MRGGEAAGDGGAEGPCAIQYCLSAPGQPTFPTKGRASGLAFHAAHVEVLGGTLLESIMVMWKPSQHLSIQYHLCKSSDELCTPRSSASAVSEAVGRTQPRHRSPRLGLCCGLIGSVPGASGCQCCSLARATGWEGCWEQ